MPRQLTDFRFHIPEEERKRITDSLLLDSGQTVATARYGDLRICIFVVGDVRVGWKGDVYKSASQFPDDLTEAIRNGTFHDGGNEDDRNYIANNNWYEISIILNRKVLHEDLVDIDLSDLTEEETKEFMLETIRDTGLDGMEITDFFLLPKKDRRGVTDSLLLDTGETILAGTIKGLTAEVVVSGEKRIYWDGVRYSDCRYYTDELRKAIRKGTVESSGRGSIMMNSWYELRVYDGDHACIHDTVIDLPDLGWMSEGDAKEIIFTAVKEVLDKQAENRQADSFRNLYAWLKPGAKVHWIDPNGSDYEDSGIGIEEADAREFEVVRIGSDNRVEHDDDVVLISGDSEAEVLPMELVPAGDVRYRPVGWPLNQEFIGRRGIPMASAPDCTTTALVPLPAENAAETDYVRIGFPESQAWEGMEDTLQDFEGNTYVRNCDLKRREKCKEAVKKLIEGQMEMLLEDPDTAAILAHEVGKAAMKTICGSIRELLGRKGITRIHVPTVLENESIAVTRTMTLDTIVLTPKGNILLDCSDDERNQCLDIEETGSGTAHEVLLAVRRVCHLTDIGELRAGKDGEVVPYEAED